MARNRGNCVAWWASNIGSYTVADVALCVRPHVVLIAVARACGTSGWQEAQRCRQSVQQLRCQRTAKVEQRVTLAKFNPNRRTSCEGCHRRLRHQPRHGIQRCLNRSDAAAKPAQRAGQGHVEATQRVCGGRHACSRLRRNCGSFDGGKQARQSGGQEVRQQAERSMPLGTIPPGNAQALRRHACITAVTGERTAARWMQRTREQAGIVPLTTGDVRLSTRLRAQWDLQGLSPTHRRAST